MTISKGRPWERPAPENVNPVLVRDDAHAAQLAFAQLDGTPAAVSLHSGDLAKTLGHGGAEIGTGLEFPMDLGLVRLDGAQPVPFAAHVIARGSLWTGEFLVAMNAAWHGDLYLGPKSHPNDGLLDITYGAMGPRQRLMAARRARSGTHLPHPALTMKRVGSYQHSFSKPTPIYVDGNRHGRATMISLNLVSDAFSVIS